VGLCERANVSSKRAALDRARQPARRSSATRARRASCALRRREQTTVGQALGATVVHPIATRASGAALQGAGGGLCLGANAATAASPRSAARSAAGIGTTQ
jgi:hypothetical protein